jgi:hypothetical protein
LSEFVKRKLPVIPVLLPGAPQLPELPLFLKAFTWVDLRGGFTDDGLDRLVWGITGQKPASVRSPVGLTPHAPVTTQSESGPLATWKEKLEYLQALEAFTAHPAQKFALTKQIEEAKEKIAELQGSRESASSSEPLWRVNPFSPTKLPRTGEYLVGRTQELAKLTRAWNNPKTNIVQIVAPCGVGKTQLVTKWREGLLDKDDHGGAAGAFDWSFYSQGTQQQASADEFFNKALRWFGETELEKYKYPLAKGERLAALVKRQRTLLILDGLEPLQHPPGPLHGELSDPSLQALLRGLSDDNPGLCLVTTREAVPELQHMKPPRCFAR